MSADENPYAGFGSGLLNRRLICAAEMGCRDAGELSTATPFTVFCFHRNNSFGMRFSMRDLQWVGTPELIKKSSDYLGVQFCYSAKMAV